MPRAAYGEFPRSLLTPSSARREAVYQCKQIPESSPEYAHHRKRLTYAGLWTVLNAGELLDLTSDGGGPGFKSPRVTSFCLYLQVKRERLEFGTISRVRAPVRCALSGRPHPRNTASRSSEAALGLARDPHRDQCSLFWLPGGTDRLG